jgi:DNA-binding NarL/FixJ family response regulator
VNTPIESGRDIALVVDDSPETLGVLTDALGEAGMTVLIARDGMKALDLVDRVTPDVVLMDALMPGLDGFETCRRLKERGQLSHVPVIFMTGLSETENIVKGLRAGGVDYVTKPIVPDELVARIGVHVANARLARSARAALDAAGRSLIAVNRLGHILWCTPQASAVCQGVSGETPHLPERVRLWVTHVIETLDPRRRPPALVGDGENTGLQISYLGQTASDEFLLHITDAKGPTDEVVLQEGLSLTAREAEVLLWISQGKSNRDIGDILGLSPRTVNKHLEQIFLKLGVENRTAAAAMAVRTMVSRDAIR